MQPSQVASIHTAGVSLESDAPAATAEHTRWQILFDGCMQNGTSSRRPYKKTAVLSISFKDTDLTNLHTEVGNLERVFEEDYGFHVSRAILESDERGQAQREVKYALAKFLREHDRPYTLLIIYYAGHGWVPSKDQKDYKMHGKATQANRFNYVEWHDAEHLLTSTSGDVFAIFDSCNAGHLCQPRGPVRYEILGACSAGQVTDPPGDSSFTSALIWALKELKSEQKGYFGTPELQRKIVEAPNLPKSQQPPLAHRTSPSLDHIVIAPYQENDDSAAALALTPSGESEPRISEYIDVRLHFSEPITDDHIKRTAEILKDLISPKSRNDSVIDGISYLGRVKVQRLASWWLQSHRARKSTLPSSQSTATKQYPSPLPLLQIPVQILHTSHSTLEVPLSATSKESGSSNAVTMYDEVPPETNEPIFVAEPLPLDEQTDQQPPIFDSSEHEGNGLSGSIDDPAIQSNVNHPETEEKPEAVSKISSTKNAPLRHTKGDVSQYMAGKRHDTKKWSLSKLIGSVFRSLKRRSSRDEHDDQPSRRD